LSGGGAIGANAATESPCWRPSIGGRLASDFKVLAEEDPMAKSFQRDWICTTALAGSFIPMMVDLGSPLLAFGLVHDGGIPRRRMTLGGESALRLVATIEGRRDAF
jgi:hypothetical protein